MLPSPHSIRPGVWFCFVWFVLFVCFVFVSCSVVVVGLYYSNATIPMALRASMMIRAPSACSPVTDAAVDGLAYDEGGRACTLCYSFPHRGAQRGVFAGTIDIRQARVDVLMLTYARGMVLCLAQAAMGSALFGCGRRATIAPLRVRTVQCIRRSL